MFGLVTSLNLNMILNLLLYALLPLGLVLVNLAMEGRQAPPKAWKVDGGKYSRGFKGFVASFYTNVGGKLQLLAKISGVLCLILGLLGVVIMLLSVLLLVLQLFGLLSPYFEPLTLTLSGLIAVVSALLLAVSTWPLCMPSARSWPISTPSARTAFTPPAPQVRRRAPAPPHPRPPLPRKTPTSCRSCKGRLP